MWYIGYMANVIHFIELGGKVWPNILIPIPRDAVQSVSHWNCMFELWVWLTSNLKLCNLVYIKIFCAAVRSSGQCDKTWELYCVYSEYCCVCVCGVSYWVMLYVYCVTTNCVLFIYLRIVYYLCVCCVSYWVLLYVYCVTTYCVLLQWILCIVKVRFTESAARVTTSGGGDAGQQPL